jgi:PHD/YefM family antitoxin component YafN of YafNO toxin-antitoxin module
VIHSTISSRDFARDVGAAKRAASEGPVFITDRGAPAFALLKIEDFYAMTGEQQRSLLDVMDEIPGGDFAAELPRIDGEPKPMEF